LTMDPYGVVECFNLLKDNTDDEVAKSNFRNISALPKTVAKPRPQYRTVYKIF